MSCKNPPVWSENDDEDFSTNESTKGWDIKYYKGLGTSTAKEAKEYFKDLAINEIKFTYTEDTEEAVDLAFAKNRADDRKDWMNAAKAEDFVDHNKVWDRLFLSTIKGICSFQRALVQGPLSSFTGN